MANFPPTLLPALHGLHAMLRKFWPEHAMRNQIPLAFWQIADDALLFDALPYLPSNVYTQGGVSGEGLTEQEIESLPEGFRLLINIFHLEDELSNEGWDGLSNLGEDGMARVITAYENVGLPKRAKVLSRVLAAYQTNPEDEHALEQAAAGELPDLVEDDEAFQVLARFIRTSPERRFGELPSDA